MPHLELISPGRRHTRFDLAEGSTIVGRHPGCDVVLDEAAVSRQHAAIVRQATATTIEDLHSRNGTFVNGQPLASPRLLVDGDEISICGRRLRYVEGQRPVSPAASSSAVAEVILEDESAAVIVSQLDLPDAGDEAGGDHLAGAKFRAVVGLNRAIGASLAADDVLPRLLEGLLEAFPRAERGFVLLVDPGTGRLVVRSRLTRSGADEAGPLRLSLSLLTAVADSRRAILSADATEDTRFSAADSVVDCRIRSVMCVPVARGDGGLLGVIQIDSRDAPGGFAAADLEVLAGVAGQAAQAIEQALAHDERIAREQLSRDLELAQRVQQGLLPSRPPELPGYEIFDHYESARHVGGDFFAYVPLAEDRLAIVLADVSGKGVAAALLMAALSADVRYCLASERDVGRAVARINETFQRGGWDDRFATLVVAVLDPRRHVATICNAGHLPVLCCGPRGGVETVAADLGGLPLGMAPPGDYRTCEVPLVPGATLLLCTDGISEALDHEQRCYGFERMAEVLAESADPADLGRRLLADVRRHAAGQVQSDDICVVCVGRRS